MEKHVKYIFLLPIVFFTSFFTVYAMEMEVQKPLIVGKVYLKQIGYNFTASATTASASYAQHLNNIGLSCNPGELLKSVFVDVVVGYRNPNHEVINDWVDFTPFVIKKFENNEEAVKTFPRDIPSAYLKNKKFGDILEIATIYGYPVQLIYSMQ